MVVSVHIQTLQALKGDDSDMAAAALVVGHEGAMAGLVGSRRAGSCSRLGRVPRLGSSLLVCCPVDISAVLRCLCYAMLCYAVLCCAVSMDPMLGICSENSLYSARICINISLYKYNVSYNIGRELTHL